jgi:hypothetical protein
MQLIDFSFVQENGHEAYHSYTQAKSVIMNYAREDESRELDE